jgi:hypothetical protein
MVPDHLRSVSGKQDPYVAGHEAAAHGMPRSANPFLRGSENFNLWDNGWLIGEAA